MLTSLIYTCSCNFDTLTDLENYMYSKGSRLQIFGENNSD